MKLIQAEHVHRSTEHPHCNSFSTVNGMQPIAQGDRARPESFGLSYWTAFGTNSAAKSPTIGSRWPSRRRARTRKHGRGKFFCFSQRARCDAIMDAIDVRPGTGRRGTQAGRPQLAKQLNNSGRIKSFSRAMKISFGRVCMQFLI